MVDDVIQQSNCVVHAIFHTLDDALVYNQHDYVARCGINSVGVVDRLTASLEYQSTRLVRGLCGFTQHQMR